MTIRKQLVMAIDNNNRQEFFSVSVLLWVKMLSVVDHNIHKDVENIFQKIIILPKLACVFPLKLCEGKFIICWINFTICQIMTAVFLYLDITLDDFEGYGQADNKLKNIIHHTPVVVTFLMLIPNSIRLLVQKEKLNEVLVKTKNIQTIIGRVAEFKNTYALIFLIVLVLEQLCEFIYYKHIFFPLLFHLNVLLLILKYFSLYPLYGFLYVMRKCFEEIEEGLTADVALT